MICTGQPIRYKMIVYMKLYKLNTLFNNSDIFYIFFLKLKIYSDKGDHNKWFKIWILRKTYFIRLLLIFIGFFSITYYRDFVINLVHMLPNPFEN